MSSVRCSLGGKDQHIVHSTNDSIKYNIDEALSLSSIKLRDAWGEWEGKTRVDVREGTGSLTDSNAVSTKNRIAVLAEIDIEGL